MGLEYCMVQRRSPPLQLTQADGEDEGDDLVAAVGVQYLGAAVQRPAVRRGTQMVGAGAAGQSQARRATRLLCVYDTCRTVRYIRASRTTVYDSLGN